MKIKTKNKKIPMRKCVGCNEMKPKKELIRILKNSEDVVVVDRTGRANGRGAYICNNIECLEKAVKNKGLERSLKMAVSQEVFAELKEEMK